MHSVRSREALIRRLWEYQSERFPLRAYVPLVAAFTYSAAAYSRLLRGADGFISTPLYLAGTVTSLVAFFWLRVLDEHKDHEPDCRYRPELPVPRGLVSLAELRGLGAAGLCLTLVLNAVMAPRLLWACAAIAFWAWLMAREFFVRDWLRRQPTAYLLSHMLIMPMIDAYTTGLDWLAAGERPRDGLWLFLLVTFLNGCLLEIGRKLRSPDMERPGVDSYTRAWGLRGAPAVWLAVLCASAAGTWSAAELTGTDFPALLIVPCLLLLTAAAGVRFLRTPSGSAAGWVDSAGGIWTLAAYLYLGAGPALLRTTG